MTYHVLSSANEIANSSHLFFELYSFDDNDQNVSQKTFYIYQMQCSGKVWRIQVILQRYFGIW